MITKYWGKIEINVDQGVNLQCKVFLLVRYQPNKLATKRDQEAKHNIGYY
jgi:hypothetical protein